MAKDSTMSSSGRDATHAPSHSLMQQPRQRRGPWQTRRHVHPLPTPEREATWSSGSSQPRPTTVSRHRRNRPGPQQPRCLASVHPADNRKEHLLSARLSVLTDICMYNTHFHTQDRTVSNKKICLNVCFAVNTLDLPRPCYQHMRVIAGLSPLARTCSQTWSFLWRHHV